MSSFDDIAKLIRSTACIHVVKDAIDQNRNVMSLFDKHQYTLLDYAICYRGAGFIRDLISTYSLPLTFPKSAKHNPYLFHAYEHGKYDVIITLLDMGADPNEKDVDGIPLLITAATDGNIVVLDTLLKCDRTDINVITKDSCNAAIYAAKNGKVGALELLIKHGIDINHVDDAHATPLMHAAIGNHYECVKLLVENGAKINERDNDGLTALNYALLGIENGSSNRMCLDYLLSKGAVKYIEYGDVERHTTIIVSVK